MAITIIQTTMMGPNHVATFAVPRLWAKNSAKMIAMVTGST